MLAIVALTILILLTFRATAQDQEMHYHKTTTTN